MTGSPGSGSRMTGGPGQSSRMTGGPGSGSRMTGGLGSGSRMTGPKNFRLPLFAQQTGDFLAFWFFNFPLFARLMLNICPTFRLCYLLGGGSCPPCPPVPYAYEEA